MALSSSNVPPMSIKTQGAKPKAKSKKLTTSGKPPRFGKK